MQKKRKMYSEIYSVRKEFGRSILNQGLKALTVMCVIVTVLKSAEIVDTKFRDTHFFYPGIENWLKILEQGRKSVEIPRTCSSKFYFNTQWNIYTTQQTQFITRSWFLNKLERFIRIRIIITLFRFKEH